jgi:hypothetical protein
MQTIQTQTEQTCELPPLAASRCEPILGIRTTRSECCNLERIRAARIADEARAVAGFRDGGKVIIAATKVEFTDVPDELNGDMEALPVKPK